MAGGKPSANSGGPGAGANISTAHGVGGRSLGHKRLLGPRFRVMGLFCSVDQQDSLTAAAEKAEHAIRPFAAVMAGPVYLLVYFPEQMKPSPGPRHLWERVGRCP